MNVARMRKALVAAGTASAGALVLGLKTEIPQTEEGWVALVMGALSIGIVAGLATYRVSNTGPGLNEDGSDVMTPEQVEAFKVAFVEGLKQHRITVVTSDEPDPEAWRGNGDDGRTGIL